MKKTKMWATLGKFAFWIWSLICLVIFMYFPGSISHIYGASLYDFSTLAEKFTRISIAKYLLDALIALFGMAFFGASCISFGTVLADIFHLGEVKNSHWGLHIFQHIF